MTLDEARECARLVVENKTRSHVGAARELAEFVLALPTPSAFAEVDRGASTMPVRSSSHRSDLPVTEADAIRGSSMCWAEVADTEPTGGGHDGDEPD